MCAIQISFSEQQRLIAALQKRLGLPHTQETVRVIETHISWVLIAGTYAYKIKKALNLGFLDFTELQARQFFCDEELRLNARLANELYIEVIAIGGTADAPQIAAEPAIEYAVKMHSFEPENQLDNLLQQGRVLPQQIDQLAILLANFHLSLPPATIASGHGSAAATQAVVQQNFAQLRTLFQDDEAANSIAALVSKTAVDFSQHQDDFSQRVQQGFIRECHGDLHAGNIVQLNNRLLPFDCLEFNAALRWIDVMDEVAFLIMDLLHMQQSGLALRFLNSYLEHTGDYAGLNVLSFYITHRALVRAKVEALRAAATNDGRHAPLMQTSRSYLALAAATFPHHRPVLLVMHGLPGSGKSSYAQAASEKFQAIRIRSDVERKRLHGLTALENSHSNYGDNLYSADSSRQTYARLQELAVLILKAGYTVIVDAAFLHQANREQFRELAHKLSVPFAILSISASEHTLKTRITQRRNDASEAGITILEKMQATQEQLQPHEIASCIEFRNEGDSPAAHHASWAALEQLLLRQASTELSQ